MMVADSERDANMLYATGLFVPDPFILQLTDVLQGLRVADPVQLYLDCRSAGERALEAAEAIRAAMHW